MYFHNATPYLFYCYATPKLQSKMRLLQLKVYFSIGNSIEYINIANTLLSPVTSKKPMYGYNIGFFDVTGFIKKK